MAEGKSRSESQVAPNLAWRVITDAPLLGCHLAREAGRLLAWDEARTLFLYDSHGTLLRQTRAPAPILSARISDDGSRIAILTGGPRLLILDVELEPLVDRPAVSGALALDIDSHGKYVVVSTRLSDCQFYTLHGKPIGKFSTKQPLTHIRFVPALPMVVGASGYGVVAGIAIEGTGAGSQLVSHVAWDERLMSNLGRLETTGDASMILASCFNLGVQRFDREGHNEGSYHVGGTALHAVPDYPGRLIAVATQEGEIALLNRAGNVRWKSELGRQPVALELDALGRYLVYGLETGEICRLDIEESGIRRKPAQAGAKSGGQSGTVRDPDWSVSLARNDEEGQGAVLAVLDEPPRVAAITRTNRLHIFDLTGRLVDQATEILGVGRILRTAPGWVAAATDRQLMLYDARQESAARVDIDLVELTHLIARPDTFGLAIVQERDRVGRATASGRWVWKRELRSPIEDIAVGPMGLTAFTCDNGDLLIFDAAGEPAGRFASDPVEPLLLTDGSDANSPAGVTWISLARRAQILRGHAPDGRVLWESPTPWEGWQLWKVGSSVVVVAPDGRALAFDGAGYLQAQGSAESSPFVFAPGPKGGVLRIIRRDVHLLCSTLDGQVLWRAISDTQLGPAVGGKLGVAAVRGRDLAWFGHERQQNT